MVTATTVFDPCRLDATDRNLCPTISPNIEEDLLDKLALQVHECDLPADDCPQNLYIAQAKPLQTCIAER